MSDAMKELCDFMTDMAIQEGGYLRMSSKQDEHLRSLMKKAGLRT